MIYKSFRGFSAEFWAKKHGDGGKSREGEWNSFSNPKTFTLSHRASTWGLGRDTKKFHEGIFSSIFRDLSLGKLLVALIRFLGFAFGFLFRELS